MKSRGSGALLISAEERQLKARDVKLWITLFKSALKSERSNSGSASRYRK